MTDPTEIAGYRVNCRLGIGARSFIYHVEDERGQGFALKQVTKREPRDVRHLEQAVAEHEVCSQFDHPSIRKSYKLMRRRRFFRLHEIIVVMELVQGMTLEQYRPTSAQEFCAIFHNVCDALHVMNKHSYVHCDIKPSNILVGKGTTVKLIDFGQSCKSGTIKPRIQGTPDYIAPEQVRRQPMTPRTDVYNLGATMYWLLTGHHIPTMIPKHGGTAVDRDPELPREPMAVNDQVPPALSRLVMDCIQPRPGDRPEGMLAMQKRMSLAVDQIQRSETGDTLGHQTAVNPAQSPNHKTRVVRPA